MGMKKMNQKAETEEEGRSGKEAVVNREDLGKQAGGPRWLQMVGGLAAPCPHLHSLSTL